QMNVHLVLVHRDFIRAQVPDQSSNPRQSPHSAGLGPWTTHCRLGATKPYTKPFQQPTHGRYAHLNSSPCCEHLDQKFLSPSRPQVTVVAGRPAQDRQQLPLISFRDLVLAFAPPPIRKPLGALLDEAISNSIHLGRGTQAALLNHRRRLTLDQGQDHFATTTQDSIRRSSTQGLHDPALSLTESSPNDLNFCRNTHEELPSLACWSAQRKCLEFLIFLSPPESRKAI